MKRKIKTIQRNNPKVFQWIVGGLIGWILTAVSMIVWLAMN